MTFSDNGTDNGTELADVNGDSLADIISGYTDDGGSNSFAAYLDTGAGWVSSSTWDPPTPFADFGVDDGVRLVDLNGDGLLDILRLQRYRWFFLRSVDQYRQRLGE